MDKTTAEPLMPHAGKEHERRVVKFLSNAANYPQGTQSVEQIETHMARVFLADKLVYKMRKPIQLPYVNCSTLAQRKELSDASLVLNRRLAPDIYLETVPLTEDDRGNLQFNGVGHPVEWLEKMRRIPQDQLLDHAIVAGRVTDAALDTLAATLSAFYAKNSSSVLSPVACKVRLITEISMNRTELAKPAYKQSKTRIERAATGLLAWIEAADALFVQRFSERLVDGHGDLRPEHVCLSDPPRVIDCLEFSTLRRLVDPVSELALLDMECILLGNTHVGERVFAGYCIASADSYPETLRRFYQAYWAMFRAKLCVWHADSPRGTDIDLWFVRAERYLEFASQTLEHLQARGVVQV